MTDGGDRVAVKATVPGPGPSGRGEHGSTGEGRARLHLLAHEQRELAQQRRRQAANEPLAHLRRHVQCAHLRAQRAGRGRGGRCICVTTI